MSVSFEVIHPHKCICGEGPVWDDENQSLYWIDVVTGQINCLENNGSISHFETNEKIGAITLTKNENLLVARKSGIYLIDLRNGEQKEVANPESGLSNNRFNDGKCDPKGRFWVGSMSDIGEANQGTLYMLQSDGVITSKAKGLTIPNGLVWGLTASKFYHIDTPTRKIVAYDYHDGEGMITNPKTIIEFHDGEGSPDGMTIDSEGMLWVAHWNGNRVSRWNPVTGEKLRELFLPVSKVTSCTFGGEELEDLYITTANIGLNEAELLKEPLAGATFVFKKIGIKGLRSSRFNDQHLIQMEIVKN